MTEHSPRAVAADVLHDRGWFARADINPDHLDRILYDLNEAGLLARPEGDVKAEALRQAADQARAALADETSGHTSTYFVRKWLHALADTHQATAPHQRA